MKNRHFRRPMRRPRNRGTRLAVGFALTGLVLGFAFMLVQNRLRPVVEQYATSRVTYLATRIINSVIDEELSNAGGVYDNLVVLEKNMDGNISALKTDIVGINQLKASITNEIAQRLVELDISGISIPLGNLMGGELFSGRGPKIPVNLVPVGSVNAKFVSAFNNAGINQTRHQIIIDTTVNMSVIMPGARTSCQVNTQVSIAETILIGEVPEGYTYIDDTGNSELLQKFNDYSQEY